MDRQSVREHLETSVKPIVLERGIFAKRRNIYDDGLGNFVIFQHKHSQVVPTIDALIAEMEALGSLDAWHIE